MIKKKILTQRKKPTHRKQPWFFYVGLVILVLGIGLTVSFVFNTVNKPQGVSVQKVQQEQIKAPTPVAKGRVQATPSPVPLDQVMMTPDEVKPWLDMIFEFFNDLIGIFMAAGGGVMLWLNIKEKRREAQEASKEKS